MDSVFFCRSRVVMVNMRHGLNAKSGHVRSFSKWNLHAPTLMHLLEKHSSL